MKKKFLLTSRVPYIPAKLVKSTNRWYIDFSQTNPNTGKRERFQKTFDLNRVKDLKLRQSMADEIVREVNQHLPLGWPFNDLKSKKRELLDTPIREAVGDAVKLLCIKDNYNTTKTFTSVARILGYYLDNVKFEGPAYNFGNFHAQQFMNYTVIKRGVGNNTYNNYLRFVKQIFSVLKENFYIEENPFDGIKRKKKAPKKRRHFSPEDRKVIASYVKENDYWMFRAILLMYYCHIRIDELRRMKFSFFDFKNGLVVLPSSVTKTGREYIKTIPTSILPFFTDKEFTRHISSLYIFGAGSRPGRKPIGQNTLTERHRKYLKYLHKKNLLNDITGYHFYSWKDTGVTDHMKELKAENVQDQCDHTSMDTTLIYRHSDRINPGYRALKFDLM